MSCLSQESAGQVNRVLWQECRSVRECERPGASWDNAQVSELGLEGGWVVGGDHERRARQLLDCLLDRLHDQAIDKAALKGGVVVGEGQGSRSRTAKPVQQLPS